MTSLFDQTDEQAPQIDESKDYFTELVGEGKKFKDPQALAKGKWYADAQIEIQNKRMDQLRNDYLALKADYDARAKLEEYLDRLQTTPIKDTSNSDNTQMAKESNAPAITPEDIDKRFEQRFKEARASEKAQQNLDVVMDKLKEQYGESYRTVLKNKTEDLGLTSEEVDAMARRSPKLFFKTMDLNQTQQRPANQSPPRSDGSFKPVGEAKKTWSYYQAQFKKDPKLYYDPKITQEMVESASRLGSEFEDGDFRKYGDSFGL